MENELGESELGTLEYWNYRYKTEIHNFKNHGDVGDVWFGEDIVQRILKWIQANVTDKSAKIIDLGCGNGMLSIELSHENYTNLTGIDYSSDAIRLAREIAEEQKSKITFLEEDILQLHNEHLISDADLMLDKGTYDAISLTADSHIHREVYIKNVCKLMKAEGRLILTSCNWTKHELCEQFNSLFEIADVIPTPEFRFGGKIGNLVASVVFKKKSL